MPLLQQEMQAIVNIGLRCAAVEIEIEDAEVRIDIPKTAFDTLTDDVVGNTTKRLYTHHFLYSGLGQMTYLARQEPAFTKVGSRPLLPLWCRK